MDNSTDRATGRIAACLFPLFVIAVAGLLPAYGDGPKITGSGQDLKAQEVQGTTLEAVTPTSGNKPVRVAGTDASGAVRTIRTDYDRRVEIVGAAAAGAAAVGNPVNVSVSAITSPLPTGTAVIGAVNQGSAAAVTGPWMVELSDGTSQQGVTANPVAVSVTTIGIGSNVIGQVGIDQTVPGTTDGVSVNRWIGSTAPTVGQKTAADSVPVVLPTDQSITLTAGILHLGSVTIDTALPAGSNLLGFVTVNAIVAGTSHIGSVTIDTALPAGEAHLGQVTVNAVDLDIRSISGTTDSIEISNVIVTVTATDLDVRPISGTTDSIEISNVIVTVTAIDLDVRPISGTTDSIEISNVIVTVTATDLDIRPMSGTTDSIQMSNVVVTVSATDLDVRPISGTTDSIEISNAVITVTATVAGTVSITQSQTVTVTGDVCSVDLNVNVTADVDAAVAGTAGLRLVGFSCHEDAAAAGVASFAITADATGAAGGKVFYVELAPNESRSESLFGSIPCTSGISIDWIAGEFDIVLFYEVRP